MSRPGPDEEPEPGFDGTWRAQVNGADVTLEIERFEGSMTTAARVRWNDIDWTAECSVFDDGEELLLDCEISPPENACFTPVNNPPYIDIRSAEPKTRITAEFGGRARVGTPEVCDGAILVDWDPPTEVMLSPS